MIDRFAQHRKPATLLFEQTWPNLQMADAKSTQIRKIRKKLRQIEHLEQVDRDLTEEEYSKVLQ